MNLNQRITEKTKLLLEKEQAKRRLKGNRPSLKQLMEEAVVQVFGDAGAIS